jgi:hypothetical protein
MAEIINFTVDLKHERIDIRYDDHTEKCFRYREMFADVVNTVEVSVSEKEIQDRVDNQKKRITEDEDYPEGVKARMIDELKSADGRAKIQKNIENEKASKEADALVKKDISKMVKDAKTYINKVLNYGA